MTEPGDILFYRQFAFPDGQIRNKLFVVIHKEPCLMLITTSNSLRYPLVKTMGCHPQKMTFFFPLRSNHFFKKPTYLVLPKVYEAEKKKIDELMRSKRMAVIGSLKSQELVQVLKCLKHFDEDISAEHSDAIFSPKAASHSSLQALADKFRN